MNEFIEIILKIIAQLIVGGSMYFLYVRRKWYLFFPLWLIGWGLYNYLLKS